MVRQLVMIFDAVLTFYSILVFVWVILSWFKGSGKVVSDIYKVLDPIVAPYVNLFRRFIPPIGGLDFSPLVALIVLQGVRMLIGLLH